MILHLMNVTIVNLLSQYLTTTLDMITKLKDVPHEIKVRRIMGDKTKVGMDVGHKDNDPMNNDPKNLRNEDPSKNRRVMLLLFLNQNDYVKTTLMRCLGI